jgi:hypothetical protein
LAIADAGAASTAAHFYRKGIMFDPNMPLRDIPADVRQTAANIARMGRIIIQADVTPSVVAEMERRLFLIVVGELHNLHECRSGFRDPPPFALRPFSTQGPLS